MSKDLSAFDVANVPAHLGELFGVVANDDLSSGVGPSITLLGYRGSKWRVRRGGEETLITNKDGDPVPSIEVVILNANKHLSKTYYQGAYTEGSDEKPTCHSHDGIRPASDAIEPQATGCAACPHNAWGSKVTESGSRTKACADVRRVAAAPIGDIKDAMLLRIPPASLRDLAEYAEELEKRSRAAGVKLNYAMVVTKLGFDPEVAYPKITFKAVRFVTPEQAELIKEMRNSGLVRDIIGLTQPENAAASAAGPAVPPVVAPTRAASTLTKAPVASTSALKAPPAAEVKQATKAAVHAVKDSKPTKAPTANLFETPVEDLEELLRQQAV